MAMTPEEKKEFLKKMGYNPRLLDPEPHMAKRKTKENVLGPDGLSTNYVDKKELLSVYRIFNRDRGSVVPTPQTLESFLKEND